MLVAAIKTFLFGFSAKDPPPLGVGDVPLRKRARSPATTAYCGKNRNKTRTSAARMSRKTRVKRNNSVASKRAGDRKSTDDNRHCPEVNAEENCFHQSNGRIDPLKRLFRKNRTRNLQPQFALMFSHSRVPCIGSSWASAECSFDAITKPREGSQA